MPFPVFNNYSETEIQAIISRLFVVRGYSVRNLHLIDRSREKGADLIASKKGENEKIAIQVKKRPSSDDVNQLHKLAQRSEQIKKYVYTEEPSVAFLKEMESLKNIDFWDGEKLIRELLADDPYLALFLLVSDTFAARRLSQIQTRLLNIYEEAKNKRLEEIRLPKPTKELFHLLWQAKDRACSIGKGLLMAGNMFDQTDRESPALTTNDTGYTANSFIRTISWHYTRDAEQLKEFFSVIENKFKGYIEFASIERRIGSEWIEIMNFWFLMPGRIETTLRLWEKNNKKTEGLDERCQIGARIATNIFDAILYISKGMAEFGMGLEGIIDDVWRYAIEQIPSEG